MHTAICAFDAKARAEQAVDSLVRAGFARHDVHIEHKRLTAADRSASHAPREDREPRREPSGDRGVLSSFGHFFTSLLGRDNPSGQADTYAQHVERGRFVVVVDADDEAGAQRAQAMLREMQGGDAEVVHRAGRRRLRDIVGRRDEPAGMVERSREPYEGLAGDVPIDRERALASHRLDARTGPELREPDLDKPNR